MITKIRGEAAVVAQLSCMRSVNNDVSVSQRLLLCIVGTAVLYVIYEKGALDGVSSEAQGRGS